MPQLLRKERLDTGNFPGHDKHTGGAFFLQWARHRRQRLVDAACSLPATLVICVPILPLRTCLASPESQDTVVSKAPLALSSHAGTGGTVRVDALKLNTHHTAQAIWPGSIFLLALRASSGSGRAVTAAGLLFTPGEPPPA